MLWRPYPFRSQCAQTPDAGHPAGSRGERRQNRNERRPAPDAAGERQCEGSATTSVHVRVQHTRWPNAGAAQVPPFGDALLTLSSEQSVEAARLLQPRYVVGVHTEGWGHFSEGAAVLRKAFDDARLGDRLVTPAPGETVALATA